ncbi:FUSC family protein [Myxococcus sp. Y35]|uniref:FUSC family protein n=1 Tax=Pseudomyxococcus flavus TaxID=3115648 RepID=UPI003CF06A00
MKTPGRAEWMFSIKSFVAAMLALYLALRLGLPRPYWAMITVYVVSQPLSGALRSKAVYRVLGTLLGASMALVLVPLLVQSPELLSLALALWVGLCLYFALLDRTPRSYVFMLGGYTAAIIGFPSVSVPTAIFDTAVARVEEITLGITCATVVHSVFFPRPLSPVLTARIDGFLRDAQRWALDALAGRSDARVARERRRLASDITELHLFSTHLPFDTSALRPRTRAVRALQDRMALLLPILSSVEDRLSVLQSGGRPLEPRLEALLQELGTWVRASPDTPRAEAQRLREACAALAPPLDARSDWDALVTTSLAVRLEELVATLQDCRELRALIRDPARPVPEQLEPLVRARAQRPLHRDRRLALQSSFAAVIAILGCCAFWIATAWPEGSAAAMMAAVYSCLFASQDDPVPAILSALYFTLASFPLGGLYLFGVLPAIDDFAMLTLVLAPVLLLVGVLMAQPRYAGRANIAMLGLLGTLGLQETFTPDFAEFINGSLAQAGGFIAAAMATRFFRSVGADWSVHRLLRLGWRELAGLSTPGAPVDRQGWTSRMLDRLGLLSPRLALARDESLEAADALGDLRLGLNVVELQQLRAHASPQARATAERLLRGVSRHFQARSAGRAEPPAPELLGELDQAIGRVAEAPPTPRKRDGIMALVGLRRALFPGAGPYFPRPASEGAS